MCVTDKLWFCSSEECRSSSVLIFWMKRFSLGWLDDDGPRNLYWSLARRAGCGEFVAVSQRGGISFEGFMSYKNQLWRIGLWLFALSFVYKFHGISLPLSFVDRPINFELLVLKRIMVVRVVNYERRRMPMSLLLFSGLLAERLSRVLLLLRKMFTRGHVKWLWLSPFSWDKCLSSAVRHSIKTAGGGGAVLREQFVRRW